ncbi:MAG: hypothetical protein J6K20_13710 [Thermoguttaceae bacterium]|nr:hypothetical protein [Thermoguttaceae bacterium]
MFRLFPARRSPAFAVFSLAVAFGVSSLFTDDVKSQTPSVPSSEQTADAVVKPDAPPTPLALKRSFGGVYPHLAWFNDEDECGTGAVVPWAGRLWAITYGPHSPNGSSDKLYEIDADLNRTTRPESVGGTNANRLIHRESKQLFIGSHAIGADGTVRTIPHSQMFGRHTAVARHLTDPKNKVYFLTMEEGLYEVDVKTLEVKEIYPDGNRPRPDGADVLPGYHGKGGYSSQGRLVYANNGENSAEARVNPNVPSGCLAEKTADGDWQVVLRKQFTEVTTKGGIDGADAENAPLWSLGWDYRSVILALLDNGKWSFYRLPKASHCYDGAHGWNTEWPRIREIDSPTDFLATMHGHFWRFPSDFSAAKARGIRPRSTYLKVIGDFAFWNGRVAFGCDDAAKSEFLNKSPLKGAVAGPGRSNSNLWFVEPEKLDSFGPALGRGAVWFDETVKRDAASDAYLFAGFDRRSAFVDFADATLPQDVQNVEITFEVDRDGTGAWEPLKTVVVPKNAPSLSANADDGDARPSDAKHGAGTVWVDFSEAETGEWIRVRSNADLVDATCFFHYKNADERPTQAAPIFDGIASPADVSDFLGARFWVRADNDRLAVVSSLVKDGKVAEERYYELTEDGRLERVPCRFEGGEPGTISRVKAMVEPRLPAPEVFSIDELSAVVVLNGNRYRLPIGSDEAARGASPLPCRLDRETATERDLFHCAGTFYELPAQNAGGFAKIRPIATDGRLIVDYVSYRGLLVLAGVVSQTVPNSTDNAATDAGQASAQALKAGRIVRSDDGGAALWLGSLDDLWSFGKAVGRGSVWRATQVAAGVPSDPFLATGFDRKTLVLENHSDADVEIALEADATATGDWREYSRFQVKAGQKVEFEFPDSFQAYWLRTVADRDATLSATFIYR